ncbi:hypothetical protein ABIB06_002732 [Bradyrhizobium sp. LB8.2]
MCGRVEFPNSSLRAKRSNPESLRGDSLDCFVARAPRNDGDYFSAFSICGNNTVRRLSGVIGPTIL